MKPLFNSNEKALVALKSYMINLLLLLKPTIFQCIFPSDITFSFQCSRIVKMKGHLIGKTNPFCFCYKNVSYLKGVHVYYFTLRTLFLKILTRASLSKVVVHSTNGYCIYYI